MSITRESAYLHFAAGGLFALASQWTTKHKSKTDGADRLFAVLGTTDAITPEYYLNIKRVLLDDLGIPQSEIDSVEAWAIHHFQPGRTFPGSPLGRTGYNPFK